MATNRAQNHQHRAPRKTVIRTPVPEEIGYYYDIAKMYGYAELAPFVRRLMEAAKRGNPRTGMMCFMDGYDTANAA